MADRKQLAILEEDVNGWNEWRKKNLDAKIDLNRANLYRANLYGADLSGAYLYEAHLFGVDLGEADLSGAHLRTADLSGAHLRRAHLNGADLSGANLSRADLGAADLSGAHLGGANFSGAHLNGADFSGANLIRTNLQGADLTDCRIYGISAWDVKMEGANQKNLIITERGRPTLTVDDVEVAQFIYLLLNNQKIKQIIDTITSRAVLILGRFTPERKVILDAMADELRKYNLLPIIFDFERSTSRDFTETIKTLAGMSLFVIADITNPKAAPLELQATVPDYQIPFVPIIQQGEQPFAMFSDLAKYDWVLKPVVTYPSLEILVQGFKQVIIDRAWEMNRVLKQKKADKKVEVKSIEDFLKLGEDQT